MDFGYGPEYYAPKGYPQLEEEEEGGYRGERKRERVQGGGKGVDGRRGAEGGYRNRQVKGGA